MYRNLTILSIVLIVALALSACTAQSPTGDTLNGTAWVVHLMGKTKPIAGTTITLAFMNGSLKGNAGCNSFGGNYQITGEGEIRIQQIFMTEMFCLDPEGVVEQENRFLTMLGQVTAYNQEATNLWFELADGDILVFTPQQ